jgi:hypothetical protein
MIPVMRLAKKIIILASILAISMFIIIGCAPMIIKLSPEIPVSILSGRHLPYRVALYMDNQFQEYHFTEQNNAEMSSMDYELGSAAKSLLIETFMRISQGVLLATHKPPYTQDDNMDATIVIEPHFASFSEEHSAILRTAEYTAHLEFNVIVYDKDGKIVNEKLYQADGAAKGQATYSPASNYAKPAEIALGNLLVLMVDDINALNLNGESKP